MNKPKISDLCEWLDISSGMASNITSAKWSPDPAKFSTRDKYLIRLCQAAIRHGHKAPELLRFLANNRRARGGAGDEANAKHAQAPAVPDSPSTATIIPADKQPPKDTTFSAIEDGIKVCMAVMRGMGFSMVGDLKNKNIESAQVTSRDFVKVLAELRQSITKFEELKKERAELLPRDDVIAAASGIWVALRSFGDQLIGQLVNPGNLPAWLEEVGCKMPDTREARSLIRDRINSLVEDRFNEMASALRGVATPGDYSSMVATECQAAMSAELKRIAGEMEK